MAGFSFLAYAAVMFAARPFVGRRFDANGEFSVMCPVIPAFTIGFAILSQAHHCPLDRMRRAADPR